MARENKFSENEKEIVRGGILVALKKEKIYPSKFIKNRNEVSPENFLKGECDHLYLKNDLGMDSLDGLCFEDVLESIFEIETNIFRRKALGGMDADIPIAELTIGDVMKLLWEKPKVQEYAQKNQSVKLI